jgi:hypothetical protein
MLDSDVDNSQTDLQQLGSHQRTIFHLRSYLHIKKQKKNIIFYDFLSLFLIGIDFFK